jgi:hypothetical protein
MGIYNTRETLRESSPAINLVFSRVSGDYRELWRNSYGSFEKNKSR